MKIEKFRNGYRIRQQYNGKRYSVVVPYKPTQKEALKLITEKMDKPTELQIPTSKSVEEYIDKYIAYCEKINSSPSTIRGYESIKRNLSEEFLNLRFSDLTNTDIQRELNRYGETRSPKTVKNAHALITAVMAKYRPEYTLVIKLPAKEVKYEYEPTTKDIEAVVELAKGSRYSIAIQLAVLGLRRGEILALTLDDLDDENVLTINKDLVLNKQHKYVIKYTAKTESSNRRITLPQALADEIRAHGCIFDGNPHTINQYLHRCQQRLGIPKFRLHMMRHFCVAYLHKMGFTDEQIMQWGGWSTDYVMKRAYRYNLDPAEAQAEITEKLGNIL